jgi:hypothetical protein
MKVHVIIKVKLLKLFNQQGLLKSNPAANLRLNTVDMYLHIDSGRTTTITISPEIQATF